MDKVMELYVGMIAAMEAKKGQGLVEYALILALISVVAIAVLQLIGTNIVARLGEVAAAL